MTNECRIPLCVYSIYQFETRSTIIVRYKKKPSSETEIVRWFKKKKIKWTDEKKKKEKEFVKWLNNKNC